MLNVHPVVSMMHPSSPARRAALLRDMSQYGQRVPIVLVDGMIWDGRARYEICRELGLTPWLVPLRGKGPIELYIYANMQRAGAPNSPTRLAMIEELSAIFDSRTVAEMGSRRDRWLRAARAEFKREWPLNPEPCLVCGQHTAFAHAHHQFPLAVQYECGVDQPSHDHDWLCPVHHQRVHMFLSGYLLGARDLSFLDSIPPAEQEEWRKIESIAAVGIRLCCEALGKTDGAKGRFDPPFGMYIATHFQEMDLWRGPA